MRAAPDAPGRACYGEGVDSPRAIGLLVVTGISLVSLGAMAGSWTHDRGNQNGSNHVPGAGELTADEESLPGISAIVEVRGTSIGRAQLLDVNDDGIPEVITAREGRIATIDPTTGAFAWASANRGLDTVIAVDDYDGDGEREILATSGDVAGGLYILEPGSGGIVASLNGLPERSGIRADELVSRDLNDDGFDDLVFAAAFQGVPSVWATSFASGYGDPQIVAAEFEGYDNLTPPIVGRLLGDSGWAAVIDQGPRQTVFEGCGAGDPGAICSSDDSLCWCPRGAFATVHDTFAFGSTRVGDFDGDDTEEVISITSHPVHTNAVALLDFAEGLAGDTPDTNALRRWYRNYGSQNDPFTHLTAPEAPNNLDGVGGDELLLSFFNNATGETDAAGAPNEDGINAPGTGSVGVFDAATGDLKASLVDAFAYGTADLDGNGVVEVIVGPTNGWSWGDGLSGYELDCAGGCSLDLVWTAEDGVLDPDIGVLDGTGVPLGPSWLRPASGLEAVSLQILDADQDGDPELLVYGDGEVMLLDADGGNVQVVATNVLSDGERIGAVDPESNTILIVGEQTLRTLDAALEERTAVVSVPLHGRGEWFVLDLGDRLAPAFDGQVFVNGLDQVPVDLLPQIVMSTDLDGDGSGEVVSRRNPSDGLGPGFEVALHEWNEEQGAFEPVWSTASEGNPDLGGQTSYSPLHHVVGNFDDAGALDIAFPMTINGAYSIAVLSGDTGDVVQTIALSKPATSAALLVDDVLDAGGAPGEDGVDEIIVSGSSQMSVVHMATGVAATSSNGTTHWVGANGDIDGDGALEVVSTISATVDNLIEVTGFDGSFFTVWGPQPLGRPTGRTQVLALADVDQQPGLDVVYGTGDGSLEAYSGATGSGVEGFPVYAAGGLLSQDMPDEPDLVRSIAAFDVDGDGAAEALIGTREGWLYAINVFHEDNPGSLLWSVQLGAGVEQVVAGDADADGSDEVLLALANGTGVVLDALGSHLEIVTPNGDDCIEETTVDVTGTASMIATVDLEANAQPGDQGIQVSGGEWAGTVEIPGTGEVEIRATGRNTDGDIVAVATRIVTSDGDPDGDGWTICGGDCDEQDASRNPGADEVCGDGIDQNCSGADDPCGETGDEGGDDGDEGEEGEDEGGTSGAGAEDGGTGCNCQVDNTGRGGWWVLGAGLLVWRRRRADLAS